MGSVRISNPQTWNRYAYAGNNPLLNIDPLGLFCVWDNGSFDSNDDSMSGSPGDCGDLGGTWFNGTPDMWQDAEGNQLFGSSDWSSSSNWAAATDASIINPNGTDIYGSEPFVPEDVNGGAAPQVPTTASTIPDQSSGRCSAQASAFVSANRAYANQIAQRTGVSATNLLGLSALESNFGTSNLATKYNNYFGLTVGSAFKGTTGVYTTPDGRNFGVYPSPGFLASGLSFAQSFQGRRVNGVTDPTTFASRLTTPPLAFNSESGYAGKLTLRISQVSPCQ